MRRLALLCSTAWLAGCGTAPPEPAGDAPLRAWRTVNGGFLAAPGAAFGMPAQPGGGTFVKLLAPGAIALRGNDLLIVDTGTQRLWRVDLALNTMTPIAGAPATPATQVALGTDLSAWVLDGIARQVLRFARDGRLMQTLRIDGPLAAPAGFALANGGATVLVADAGAQQWSELRPVGSVVVTVRPGDAQPVNGVDGIAVAGDTVFVLDRNAAVVHVVQRDGRVTGRLGEGALKQPVAIAADRNGRVFVVDAQDRSVKVLSATAPPLVFDAAQLQVQQIGGLAVDDGFLAVSDRLVGQVVIHTLRAMSP